MHRCVHFPWCLYSFLVKSGSHRMVGAHFWSTLIPMDQNQKDGIIWQMRSPIYFLHLTQVYMNYIYGISGRQLILFMLLSFSWLIFTFVVSKAAWKNMDISRYWTSWLVLNSVWSLWVRSASFITFKLSNGACFLSFLLFSVCNITGLSIFSLAVLLMWHFPRRYIYYHQYPNNNWELLLRLTCYREVSTNWCCY